MIDMKNIEVRTFEQMQLDLAKKLEQGFLPNIGMMKKMKAENAKRIKSIKSARYSILATEEGLEKLDRSEASLKGQNKFYSFVINAVNKGEDMRGYYKNLLKSE